MTKVVGSITTSIDGYVAGPDHGRGRGLGSAVNDFATGSSTAWTYDSGARGEPIGEGKAWFDEAMSANGAVIAGRGTCEPSATFIGYRLTSCYRPVTGGWRAPRRRSARPLET